MNGINLCIECGEDMGDCNPRQLCCKTYCPKQFVDEFLRTQHSIQISDFCQKTNMGCNHMVIIDGGKTERMDSHDIIDWCQENDIKVPVHFVVGCDSERTSNFDTELNPPQRKRAKETVFTDGIHVSFEPSK